MDKQRSEHIENRFQQAAENFHPPSPGEEAWKNMEALLDETPKRRRLLFWWWSLGFVLLITGAAGGYYFYNRPVRLHAAERVQQSGNPEPAVTTHARPTVAPTGANPGNPPVAAPETKQVPAKSLDGKTGISAPEQVRKNTAGKPQDHLPYGRSVPDKKTSSPVLWQSSPSARSGRRNQSDRQAGYSSVNHPGQQSGSFLVENSVQEQEKPRYSIPSPLIRENANPMPVVIPDSILQKRYGQLALSDSLQRRIDHLSKEANQRGKPTRFYVVVSGSRNTTDLRKFDTKNQSYVYGGEIGYHVGSRLSVQAGFHVGRKIYFAGPGDYTFKSHYWDSVRILKIDANCLIFDMPLSLRFDLLHHRNNAFYTIAGISSFLMRSENYKYHYNTSTGWYSKSEASYKGHLDLFSSINLSAGFEQRVFRSFFLQAEPYAKLPISGVGAGSIKLYSLGLQAGIKYQPVK